MISASTGKRRRESIDLESLSIHCNKTDIQSVYRSILLRSTFNQRSFGRKIIGKRMRIILFFAIANPYEI
jgi:hypothetical protein